MLTKRYLTSAKNIPAIFQQIVSGTAPEKFNVDHLKKIGFASSNDRAIIPLLKDLNFLTGDGVPTQRYHNYRNSSLSKKVLGEAIKEAYQAVFHINEKPTKSDRPAIEGLFKSTHNVSDKVAELEAATFFCLLDLADITGTINAKSTINKKNHDVDEEDEEEDEQGQKEKTKKSIKSSSQSTISSFGPNLRYNIEIHLPASKDIEVYNAIFKSLKQHLIDE